ncbi:FAD-dependent oxidoreductase [Amycolatopsis samaneae]|uniref:FAD-dependent oxidoreductase n=1 Tax=Amycolatopsis samaneae TaxID=664691 RepID=A0ABW5GRV4_9PSEU
MARVLVVGAGYAGVMAANRLAAAGGPEVSVTVVNPRPEFVERIRLHEHAAGGTNAVRPVRGLLRRDVRLRVGTVESIADRSARLDDGAELGFDFLLYAVGSTAARDAPGTALGAADLGDAETVRTRLRRLPAQARVVVVGGGLTGIESAAEISYRYPSLTVELVSRSVAGWLPAPSRARIERGLARAWPPAPATSGPCWTCSPRTSCRSPTAAGGSPRRAARSPAPSGSPATSSGWPGPAWRACAPSSAPSTRCPPSCSAPADNSTPF